MKFALVIVTRALTRALTLALTLLATSQAFADGGDVYCDVKVPAHGSTHFERLVQKELDGTDDTVFIKAKHTNGDPVDVVIGLYDSNNKVLDANEFTFAVGDKPSFQLGGFQVDCGFE